MVRRWAIACVLISASTASAVELHHIKVKTGIEGLVRAPVTVTNKAAEAIACTAQLAHWYSMGLGTIAPGKNLRIALWLEEATRTPVLLNDKQENMPVEAVWCGIAGRAYETRAAIMPGVVQIACAGDERLVCD